MSLKEKYSKAFDTLKLVHHVPRDESKKSFGNIPLVAETYAFINAIISPALEKRINEYLISESQKKFISTFEFTIHVSNFGKVYLLHDGDTQYFGKSLQIFQFNSTTDTDLIYQYIKHCASENSFFVKDYNYEGSECLILGIQY